MAPVLKILGVPRLPPGGSLGTGKRGTVPKIWRAVPIFLARVNGVLVSDKVKYVLSYCSTHKRIDRQYLFLMHTYPRLRRCTGFSTACDLPET